MKLGGVEGVMAAHEAAGESPEAFTLEGLRGVLVGEGLEVVDWGDDDRPELAHLRDQPGVRGTLPGPCFYVTVVGEGDLIDFTRVVTEAVWGRFTRGLMKFDGRREDDGRVRITVTEVRN